jgi:hypothetical protein
MALAFRRNLDEQQRELVVDLIERCYENPTWTSPSIAGRGRS